MIIAYNQLTVSDNWFMQVNKTDSPITLKFDEKEFYWNPNEPLLTRLEAEGVVKLVFPLHGTLTQIQPLLLIVKL